MNDLPDWVLIVCAFAAVGVVAGLMWLVHQLWPRWGAALEAARVRLGWRHILFHPHPLHRVRVRQLLRRITCDHRTVAPDYLRDLQELADLEGICTGYQCPACYTWVWIHPRPPQHVNCRCVVVPVSPSNPSEQRGEEPPPGWPNFEQDPRGREEGEP